MKRMICWRKVKFLCKQHWLAVIKNTTKFNNYDLFKLYLVENNISLELKKQNDDIRENSFPYNSPYNTIDRYILLPQAYKEN